MKFTVTGGLILLLLLLAPPSTPAADQGVPDLDRDGYAALLTEHRGKVVLVNFWATWCKPCRYEIPGLSRIYREYADEELAVVGVNVDYDPRRLEKFLAKQDMPYPVYRGDMDLKREQGAFVIPLTLVYTPEGDLAERHVGYVPPQTVEDAVRRYLPSSGRELARSTEPPGSLAQAPVLGENPL